MRFKLFSLLCAAVFAVACANVFAAQELAHAIFIKVNGRTITQEQVIEVVKYLVKREYNNVMPHDEQELERIQNAAIRDLVRALLIQDEADKAGIRLESGQLKYIEARSGLSPEELTPTIRRLLSADELFDDIMMQTGTPVRDPSPGEIKDFYLKNRDDFKPSTFIVVRTIFIATDGQRSQAFYKAQGEQLLEEIRAISMPQRTQAFAAAAKEFSQDIFAQFGGLITADSPEKWVPKDFDNKNPDGSDIFPPTMALEIRKLNKPGDSRLAVSEDGIHLLYCDEVQGGKPLSWSEASRIIEFVLKDRARNQRLRRWLNQVYDRSDVRWHDGAVYEKESLTEILLPSERGAQQRQ